MIRNSYNLNMKFKYVIYYLIKFILRNYMNFIIHDKKIKKQYTSTYV